MRDWFAYKNGYVNVDEENLYFTNSGNWSEIKGLDEKGIQKINRFKRFRMDWILVVLFSLALLKVFGSDMPQLIKLPVVLISPLSLYLAYRYFLRETGSRFKLPKNKIQKIRFNPNQVTLIFLNGLNEEDFEDLNFIDSKGLEILRRIETENKPETAN